MPHELTRICSFDFAFTTFTRDRYAFSPAAHMTESHKLNTAAASRQLVSEWAYYWNLSRPVLLEKTPTDMVTSRLLQVCHTNPKGTASIAYSTSFRHGLRYYCCSLCTRRLSLRRPQHFSSSLATLLRSRWRISAGHAAAV